MSQDRLVESLVQVKELVEECIRLAGRGKARAAHGSADPKRPSKAGLPEKILALRDKGFFSQPRTGNEVQAKLNPTYPCELDRVLMALLRLMKRKKLRKASKIVEGKKQVAYVW